MSAILSLRDGKRTLRKSYSPISIYEYAAWVPVAKGADRRSTLTRSPFRLTRTPHSAASLMMVAAF